MKTQVEFRKLFEPGRIGRMVVKNRIVLPPMGTNFATDDGYVTERMIDYYEARARGGAGLVIVEVVCVDFPVGKAVVREASIDDDRFIPGLGKLSQAIKKHGARAAVQLHHAGKEAVPFSDGTRPVSSSAIPSYSPYKAILGEKVVQPRELSVSEIHDIIARFARAAERARKAGFDGVEIHGATAYLLASFLSPAANKRQDAYGGELKNRARFLLETIEATRQLVGRDYPVWCRLNALEFGVKGGITLEEAIQVSRMAQEAGIDAINVSIFAVPKPPYLPSMAQRPGSLVPLAEAIKHAVTIPIMVGGNIDPVLGEEVLEKGHADFIYMGRALIADPDLPNKTATGRLGDIRPCLCCDRCIGGNLMGGDLQCSVNAAVGREREYTPEPAKEPKRVLVVGGGPGGMEAARVARLRGHEVTLYEREGRLGGQMNVAVKPPHKGRIHMLIDYYARQLQKLGVTVKLSTEATPALIENLKPEVIVLATGVVPFIPPIPGGQGDNVVLAEDVLCDRVQTGSKVIVIGGELVGCETAEFLTDRGKQVTITRRGDQMALNMPIHLRALMMPRLTNKGVTMLTGVTYEKITRKGLTVTGHDGHRRLIEADTIVLAAGALPNADLMTKLQGTFPETYAVGDCSEPHGILEAIADGYWIATRI